jgi:hypothetical protein
MKRSIFILAAMLALFVHGAGVQFINLQWASVDDVPSDWVVFRSSPTLTGNPTNWPVTTTAIGWQSQDPVPVDGVFTLWVKGASGDWRAVYAGTNTGTFVTNRILIPNIAAIPITGSNQFFVTQFSNNSGGVSFFSNPVGLYFPRTNTTLWPVGK